MLLDPHAGLIIWTIITFLVVLVILKSKVWGPLLAALDEREQRIRDALAAADLAREQAEAHMLENERRLAEAGEEARKIVGAAHEAAAKVEARMVAEAREEAHHTTELALRAIESEKRAALESLRREVADLAVQAAGTILDAELDNERNRRLIDDFIAELPESRGN